MMIGGGSTGKNGGQWGGWGLEEPSAGEAPWIAYSKYMYQKGEFAKLVFFLDPISQEVCREVLLLVLRQILRGFMRMQKNTRHLSGIRIHQRKLEIFWLS